MSVLTIFTIQFVFAFITFSFVIGWLVLPHLKTTPLFTVLTILVVLHCLRVLGMVYLLPTVTDPTIPHAFAYPTAYGDLISAILAMLSVVALHYRKRYAIILVWIFNIFGFLDLLLATFTANQLKLLGYNLGAAWFIPAFVVPFLLVTHIAIFWVLVKRGKEAKTESV